MVRYFLTLGFALLIGVTVLFNQRMNRAKEIATVSIESAPLSTDPIEYDSAAHHVAFRSVHSSIVSQYVVGKIEPILVDSWFNSQDFRKWTFSVRSGLRFDNNDPIEAKDIANSWLRAAHIMRKKGSNSGLFERLVGYGEWKGLGSQLKGIQVIGNKIELTFETPFRDLLNSISFGLYAVVHRSCYDPTSGAWINNKCAIASGPYRITSWTDQQLELTLRESFGKQAGAKPIKTFQIRWLKENRLHSDLIMGFSNEDSLSDDREFHGTPTANFAYVRCHSWLNPNGPCGSVEKRRALRDAFYKELLKLQDAPDFSIFPLSIPGIQVFKLKNESLHSKSDFSIRFRASRLETKPFRSFNKSVIETGRQLGCGSKAVPTTFDEMYKEMDGNPQNYTVDLSAEYSGLLIEAPKDDIRFMFLSKEGIRLPDTDGRITAELKKPDFDPQVINELIWDQAAIWPLAHFSLGFWAKKDLFDFSMLNLSLPPTDLQYIQWK